MPQQLEMFAPPMEDFIFVLTVAGEAFSFTLNECNNDSAWVGDMLRDGVACDWDDAVLAIAEAHGPYYLDDDLTDEEEAERWLNSALDKRVAWQREQLAKGAI